MDQLLAAPNLFSGGNLDRLGLERSAPGWLESAKAARATNFVVADQTGLILLRYGLAKQLALLEADHPLVVGAGPQSAILLGAVEGARRVLIEAPKGTAPGAGFVFSELRPIAPLLSPTDATLAAYARALVLWRARQAHCGVCGAQTISTRAGHVLRCTNPACATQFFPRTDPAIIVLVTDGDYALLGRQASWPAGRYSTLAGFVEPGESLEDAVRREVMEETGVAVLSLAYQASQPWPFPAQLMLGFRAVADRFAARGHELDGELEESRWFSRQEIMDGTIRLPPPESISYRLINSWAT